MAADSHRKQAALKEKYTSEMITFGLWQSTEQVSQRLDMLKSEGERKEALKAQLNFRKHVLQQPVSDKKLYQFSSKADGIYSPEKLAHNLCVILNEVDYDGQQEDVHTGSYLVGNQILHKFMDDGRERIYRGRVISQVPGYPEWFNVKYEADSAIYTYTLLDDLAAGDLVLLSRYQLSVAVGLFKGVRWCWMLQACTIVDTALDIQMFLVLCNLAYRFLRMPISK